MIASLDYYNVIWDSPSRDHNGSMPIGNGDIGLNLWCQEDRDLVFYIGKTDAWSENARLLKLGRIRIQISPEFLVNNCSFQQILNLRKCEIVVRLGQHPTEIVLRIWVDANQPVIRIEANGDHPFDIQAHLEVWRNEDRFLEENEIHSAYGLSGSPESVVVYADTTITDQNKVIWYHRNCRSIWAETLALQGMESWLDQGNDPLQDLTFGGLIQGENFANSDGTSLKSTKPEKHHLVSIHLLTAQTVTPQQWIDQLQKLSHQTNLISLNQARKAHQKWWTDFWNRSWIFVSGDEFAETVTRGYILQRFMTASAGRGKSPIKFNGSIFTVDALLDGQDYDADYRNWGGPYWFQNTRLSYWPLLASGDFDMLQPYFQMYIDAMPLAKARTLRYFGHDGVFFPETMYFWGAYPQDNYGWPNQRTGLPVHTTTNQYIRYEWQSGLELLTQMLDYYAITHNDGFLCSTLLPIAEAVITFYDQHYPRSSQGELRIEPAQALETYWDSVNPMPEIAGLRFVLPKLLVLPTDLISHQLREQWTRLLLEVPELPTRQIDDQVVLSPASEIGPKNNQENPELYAIFPYRLFGVSKPNIELARQAFTHREHRGSHGWYQDDTQAAFLGETDQAYNYIVNRFRQNHPQSRFPAFWGPNFDWLPDQTHGGNGMMALQTMLMQTEDQKIILFPAWPQNWNVAFKLHAPLNTTIEGVYNNRKLEHLSVTPEARFKDLAQMAPE